MTNLTLNPPSPPGYRRLVPLDASTLSWLNGSVDVSEQNAQATPPAADGRAPAPTDAGDADTRISKAALDAAHAVNRHYREQLMRRRSRSGAPQ